MVDAVFIEELVARILPPVVVAIGAGCVAYIRKMQKVHDDLCKKVEMLQKTIIVLAKTIDNQVKRDHPNSATELDELVRELLSKD
jgi:hypothetical protein